MTQSSIADATTSTRATDASLFSLVNSRLDHDDPELRSLLWLLREGVIGRGHFQDLLDGELGDRLYRTAC